MTAPPWLEVEVEVFDQVDLVATPAKGLGVTLRPAGRVAAVYVDGRLDRVTWLNENGGVELAPAHMIARLSRDTTEGGN